ncbi:MAG: lipoyl(octanoyl) transferase LipB [Phycisphaerae bacterium]|nr:lipoyl(octanoyl) transferase LipB [Phycisphaerae bacterium]
MTSRISAHVALRDLGRISYHQAHALQQRLQAEVIEARDAMPLAPMPVLLLEHDPPVITVSRRPGAGANLIATPELLARNGVTVAETDRGGDITYHGPGQLVVYPMLDLNRLGLRIHGYMRLLEQIVIDTIREFGVDGARDACATGVWVNGRKICAMGVRVSRWVTMHGLALNVTTNLDHFGLIVPCGLAGRSVTSLALESSSTPSMEHVKQTLGRHLVSAVDAAVDAGGGTP